MTRCCHSIGVSRDACGSTALTCFGPLKALEEESARSCEPHRPHTPAPSLHPLRLRRAARASTIRHICYNCLWNSLSSATVFSDIAISTFYKDRHRKYQNKIKIVRKIFPPAFLVQAPTRECACIFFGTGEAKHALLLVSRITCRLEHLRTERTIKSEQSLF